jgi:putative endonuclease
MRKKRLQKKFKRSGRFWVYIVECSDNSLYTGYTPDIEKRIKPHNKGRGAKYTRDRRPVRPVWLREYRYFKLAFLEEKRIKRLTRAEKDILVREG